MSLSILQNEICFGFAMIAVGDLVTHWGYFHFWHTYKERPQRPVTFKTFDQSDKETWPTFWQLLIIFDNFENVSQSLRDNFDIFVWQFSTVLTNLAHKKRLSRGLSGQRPQRTKSLLGSSSLFWYGCRRWSLRLNWPRKSPVRVANIFCPKPEPQKALLT